MESAQWGRESEKTTNWLGRAPTQQHTQREKARTDSRRSRDDVDSFIAYLLYTTAAVAPHLPYSFFSLIISSLPPLFSRSDKEGVSKEGGSSADDRYHSLHRGDHQSLRDSRARNNFRLVCSLCSFSLPQSSSFRFCFWRKSFHLKKKK